MASVVSICNLALARMGQSGTVTSIDPPEGSTHAKTCAVFYPMSLQTLLEAHDWRFATSRFSLTRISGTDTHGWAGVYALPSDFMRMIRLRPKQQERLMDEFIYPYSVETVGAQKVLYTDCPSPVLEYIRAEPEPGVFTPLFTDALAWHLAGALTGALVKGTEGAKLLQAIHSQYQSVLYQAMTEDARHYRDPVRHVPTWIRKR